LAKKISYTTLGCKLNFSESATIVRQFIDVGYELAPYGQPADITIINTCTVTAQAERKSKFAVKKAKKVSPAGKIVVIGTAAQLRPENFAKIDGVDMVVGANEKFNIFKLLENPTNKTIYACDIATVNRFDNAYSINERTRSFLKIQDGCDYPCTYCTIPKARGKSRNAKISEIITEAEIIASQGVKEIILTGVNIGDFGKSTNETFFDLIKQLDKVEGIERYRISSIEPNLLTNEIIEFTAQSQKFMPHFHIPLQSGADNVLKLMKRRYNTKQFAERINKVYSAMPDVFFGIDLIVGFPGDPDDDFKNTYNLLKSLPISYLHLFPYSDRPGTPASKIFPKVPSERIKERENKLKQLSDEKHKNFYKKFIGTSRKVLFEKKQKNGLMFGYSDNYLRVAVEQQEKYLNQILSVKLVDYKGDFFIGKVE